MELETEIVSRPDATTNSGPSLPKKKKKKTKNYVILIGNLFGLWIYQCISIELYTLLYTMFRRI